MILHRALLAVLLAHAGPVVAWAAPMTPTVDKATGPAVEPDRFSLAPLQAQTLYDRAAQNLAAGDLTAARRGFKAAIKIAPTLAGGYLGLAEVEYRTGSQVGAGEALSAAVRAVPNVSAVQLAWGRYLFLRKRTEEAVVALQKAVDLDPKAAQPHLDLADVYLSALHQPDKAALKYGAAIVLAPDNAGAHYGLGRSYVALGRMDDATKEFEEAKRLAPTNPQPSLALGELRAKQNDPAAAATEYENALRIQPDLAAARLGRADALAASGEINAAVDEYKKALDLNNKLLPAQIGLGTALLRAGDLTASAAAYRKVLAVNPKQPIVLNNLAWIATQNRAVSLDEALTWAKEAVAQAPDEPTFRTTLGWVYHQRGDFRPAAAELQAAVTHQPTAERYYYLGRVRQDMGEAGAARDAYKMALQMSPNFTRAQQALGQLGTP